MTRTNAPTNCCPTLSRRSVIKGAAAVGATLSFAGLGLAGCAPRTPEEEVVEAWCPGTYTAEVSGHNAPYTVAVTFSTSTPSRAQRFPA